MSFATTDALTVGPAADSMAPMDSKFDKVGGIGMEEFIESATRAVLRALETSALNPQPLPPREGTEGGGGESDAAAPLNPQPLPPFDITVGIILSGGDDVAVTRSASKF